MTEPRWLTADIVIALHNASIGQFGGSVGIRDRGLLESAIARPLNLYAYQSPDIFTLAAAYGYGITQNHAFIDGNKRTGLAAMAVFLGLNGYQFEQPGPQTVLVMEGLADGRVQEAELAEWLRNNSEKRRSLDSSTE
ncbi:type II toxin-antitoxin system death-on-curing family toxin [Synechococcus sp. PCC 7336]|uniref:type II toxin-antitoxin system death-on-curing family toxin n=1 Tax=Synechococcus sp. PCC 7336 TaxID=195250 RepID=UPI000374ABC9|nr:type II toxin-antitoxin system death-on-curing family toxin [Synechococcus sp. PCC 7336]